MIWMVNGSGSPTLPPIGWRDPAGTLVTCSWQVHLLEALVPDAKDPKSDKNGYSIPVILVLLVIFLNNRYSSLMNPDPVRCALSERFGWIALDFVNTLVITRSGPVDAFRTVDLLVSWMDLADPPGWPDLKPKGLTASRILHAEAVRLRVAIDALLSATAARERMTASIGDTLGRPLRWVRTQNRIVGDTPSALTLECERERLHPAGALGPIAEDAVRLVASVPATRLRRCRADDCLRWFADTSKGGRRSWCSMATCGNRAKAARFRARHEGAVDAT